VSELFQVRDVSGEVRGRPFSSKRKAKTCRDELQGGKINPAQVVPAPPARKFFVTLGKDHHRRLPIGKW
jgi:hypothetical protein